MGSNHPDGATVAADEYARRFGCEEGFRDTKWWIGFAKAQIRHIKAWSRIFALMAITLLVLTTLGSQLLLMNRQDARELLRRAISRCRGRCELAVVSAMIRLLKRDQTLYQGLNPHLKLKLDKTLKNMP